MSDLNSYEESLAIDLAEADDVITALTEQLEAARHDADEAEAYAWQLEQHLAKAVETLRSVDNEYTDIQWGPELQSIKQVRAALAELEGGE